jgi:hypothetical protein
MDKKACFVSMHISQAVAKTPTARQPYPDQAVCGIREFLPRPEMKFENLMSPFENARYRLMRIS